MKVVHELAPNINLKIVQDSNLNTYTFDSILLANFVKVTKRMNKAIDLCSGNAPIGMLLTTKKKNLNVKCIEIQEIMCDLAKESIQLNNLEDSVEIICDDLKNINEKIGKNEYDLITCNPPYFRLKNDSNINEKSEVAIARHEIKVQLEDIIKEAKKLLNNCGAFAFVHRPDRIDEIIILLNKYEFSIKRIRFIYPRINEEANTVLIEATKRKQQFNKVIVEAPLYVYKENSIEYTDEALEIMEF